MDDLMLWAKSSLWDDEPTQHAYIYPLHSDPAQTRQEGLRLVAGNSLAEVYEMGPYICVKSSKSHIGPFRHAIDFIVPDGTPVVAAFDGRVVEIKEDSNTGGPTPAFRDTLNYLTIEHANGEYSQYCHLAQDSIKASGLHINARVREGQRIGTVWKTGWTDIDHLHFIVFRNARNESPFSFKSLKIRFRQSGY